MLTVRFDKVQGFMKNYWTLTDTFGIFVQDHVAVFTDIILSQQEQLTNYYSRETDETLRNF